jgi:hypothetical protein
MVKNTICNNSRIAYAIVAIPAVLLLAAIVPSVYSTQPAAAISPYNSGYNHGVSDARIGSHDYLDGSGGASAHTAAFMQGYNDGYGSRYTTTTTNVERR